MKTISRVVIVIALLALINAAFLAQNGNDLFQQALKKERTEGNYPEAIKIYQTIVQTYGSDHKLAAKALFQMGQAYEKLNNTEARKAYERVVREFKDQPVAKDAERQLALMATAGVPGLLTSRLVCHDNCSSQGSISADGRRLAFVENSDVLAVRNMMTRDITRLTATRRIEGGSGSFARWPTISPDGRQIAYVWDAWTADGAKGTRCRCEMRIVTAESDAKPRMLFRNPEVVDFVVGTWAPDNKSILLLVERDDQTWELARASTSDGSLRTIKSLGWRVQLNAGRPTFSPDGRYVAYAALATQPSSPQITGNVSQPEHIWVLASDGSSEVEVVKGASINENPVWSSDGKHLLFVSDRAGSFGLWSVRIEGGTYVGEPVQIIADLGRNQVIGMTLANSYYYDRRHEGEARFVLRELHDGRGLESGDRETIIGGTPTLSPDGKRVAFFREISINLNRTGNRFVGGAAGRSEMGLLVYTFESRDEVRVDSSKAGVGGTALTFAGRPVWSHDGASLFLGMRSLEGKVSTYRFNLKTGDFKEVAPTTPALGDSVLSADDRTLYMVKTGTVVDGRARTDRIMALDLSNGQERTVAEMPLARSLTLSPDDKTLYLTACEGDSNCKRNVIALDVVTGRATTVLSLPNADSVGPELSLSPDGRTLALLTGSNSSWQISQVGVDGSGYTKIYAQKEASGWPRLKWPADGSGITFTVSTSSSRQLMRVAASGGNPAVLGTLPSYRDLVFSSDGSQVVISTEQSSYAELRAIDNLSSYLGNH